jgi:hypothetical protein
MTMHIFGEDGAHRIIDNAAQLGAGDMLAVHSVLGVTPWQPRDSRSR